jgi:cyanophycinase
MLMGNGSLPADDTIAVPEPDDRVAIQGKLVICGGGPTPDEVRSRFVELAGGRGARIVVIPTASELAEAPDVGTRLEVWRAQQVASVELFHARSREEANQPEFLEPLEDATGVWFTGGRQSRVIDTYRDTAAEKSIRAVFEKGGVIGGTSAGAAVMSAVMILRGNPEVEVGTGFGFLPEAVVDQHFIARNRQARLLKVLADYPKLVGLGIDESTAVIVNGNQLSVVGQSQVVTCLSPCDDYPAEVQTHRSGEVIDLAKLVHAAAARLKKAVAKQPVASSKAVVSAAPMAAAAE